VRFRKPHKSKIPEKEQNKQAMIVMKFGGTSVADAKAIGRVSGIIKSRLERRPVVVVSAVGHITDHLVTLSEVAAMKNRGKVEASIAAILAKHKEIMEELGVSQTESLQKAVQEAEDHLKSVCATIMQAGEVAKYIMDELLSIGEFLSANIVSAHLQSIGIDSCMADAREIMVTNCQFGKAQPMFAKSADKAKQVLLPLAEKNIVPVTQGFVGRDSYGRTTTLGRGGSDYSATLIGAMLNAEKVEIWSDVDGVLTADPSLVPDAKRIRYMSFREAAELAYFGAKVLHPSTILPAVERGIPVYVLNSMRPEDCGTKIAESVSVNGGNGCIVKSIAYKENISVIAITSTRMLMAHGFMATIFDIFNRYQTSVDLVSTSEVSVSITVDNAEKLNEIKRELGRFAQVEVQHNKAIVCLVGEQMRKTPGMPARIFSAVQDVEIHLISQGASEINISFVIDESLLPQVVTRLHQEFFSGELDPKVFAV